MKQKELESNYKKVDKYIYSKNMANGFGILVLIQALVLIYAFNGQHLWTVIFLAIPFLIFTIKLVNTNKLSSREKVSYGLFAIYKGIKSKKLNKKYIKMFSQEFRYEDENDLKNRDSLYINEKIIMNKTSYNINQIAAKLNHVINHKTYRKIDTELIRKAAEAAYTNKVEELAKLLDQAIVQYPKEEQINQIKDLFNMLWKNKIVKTTSYLILLFFILAGVHLIFDLSREVVAGGYFVLAAVILTKMWK